MPIDSLPPHEWTDYEPTSLPPIFSICTYLVSISISINDQKSSIRIISFLSPSSSSFPFHFVSTLDFLDFADSRETNRTTSGETRGKSFPPFPFPPFLSVYPRYGWCAKAEKRNIFPRASLTFAAATAVAERERGGKEEEKQSTLPFLYPFLRRYARISRVLYLAQSGIGNEFLLKKSDLSRPFSPVFYFSLFFFPSQE